MMLRTGASVIRYALSDMRCEPLITLLTALLYCVILGPLVLLYVVKTGVITAWADDLSRDTRNREVLVRGEYALDAAALQRLAAIPELDFIVPEPAYVVRTWRWRRVGEDRGPRVELDLRTTASGDPVLEKVAAAPAGFKQVALSQAAAQALEAGEGDTVNVLLRRMHKDGRMEATRVEASVVAVVPERDWPARTVFVDPKLARAIEEFSWFLVDPDGAWPDRVVAPDAPWKSMRVYARSIRDAPALRDRLREEGYEVVVQTDQIDNLLRLEAGLTRLFSSILLLSAAGFAAASFLTQWVGVSRKRGALALMVLSGFRRGHVALFPIVQSLAATTFGTVLALLLLAALFPLLSQFVADHADGATLVMPEAWRFGAAYVAACGVGVAGCLGAVFKIANLDIAETLRSD